MLRQAKRLAFFPLPQHKKSKESVTGLG